MIRTAPATLHPMSTAAGRQMLVGRTTDAIPAGTVLVLTRIAGSDRYTLHAVAPDPADRHDPNSLASFVSPQDLDAIEAEHALAITDEATAPRPKPAKRRKAVRR